MPTLTRFKPFYSELFDFITGNAGKEFVQLGCGSGDIGWSRVIYDLIYNISSQKLSRKIDKSLPDSNKTRGFGHICYICGDFSDEHGLVSQQIANENGNNSVDDGISTDEENNGLTIIEITTVINSDNYNDYK